MTGVSTYGTIAFAMVEHTGHLILNQPPSNVMDMRFFTELQQLVEEIKRLENLKAMVISGAGRHFSSGAAPDQLVNILSDSSSDDFFKENIHAFEFFTTAPFPVISAIRGVCIGSAMELVLFTHFRFCGEDAVFGLPESSFNLMPGIGGISHMAALAGKARTMELVLRGNMFPAAAALEYGIVDKVLPRREVLPFAFSFAEKISQDYRKEKKVLYLERAHAH